MLPDTQYYVRVRHRGENSSESEWSDAVAFKTAQEGGFEEIEIWYGPATSSTFGFSVALSLDGKTALVGAYNWASGTGKALVYTRSGSTWSQQADLPHALGTLSYFGYSVSLSADGNTALVGAPFWNSRTGKTLVYTRSGSTWTQQADLPGLGSMSYFGYSVALSADGNTALVGAWFWNSATGTVCVYTRSGSTWTQQADLPHALGTGTQFGISVALSADGNTALVGAPNWTSTTGKALVYTRSGSTWTQQADLSHNLTSSQFGRSLALSADGNTALVGASGWSSNTGKAFVYTRSGSTWTQQADLSHNLTSSQFGYSVALSADGNTALVGASGWSSNTGKVLVYTRSGSIWTLHRELDNPLGSGAFGTSVAVSGDTSTALVGASGHNSNTGFVAVYEQAIPAPGVLEDVLIAEFTGPSTNSQFGHSVSLSADGNTALVGAWLWNSNTGKALVYTRSGSTWTQQADLPHSLGTNSNFGWSVALCADGNTALVGAYSWNSSTGKVLVYTRSGSTWTQQADLAHALGASHFGVSVALSADGDTALVGARWWNSRTGKALVYTRSGSTWTQQADLPHTLGTNNAFGYSVALSADGNTALVGASLWNSSTGKAFVYTRSGSTWTQQADLPHTLGSNSYFGVSVSLSADGNTALVGAYFWNGNTGKALIYTRSGSTWTQQADLPHALGTNSYFGHSVALSADGNTALVGAYYWNIETGKALVYTRIAGEWFLRRELAGVASSAFGYSVSLSGDGSQAVIGAPYFSSNTGKAFFYQ